MVVKWADKGVPNGNNKTTWGDIAQKTKGINFEYNVKY